MDSVQLNLFKIKMTELKVLKRKQTKLLKQFTIDYMACKPDDSIVATIESSATAESSATTESESSATTESSTTESSATTSEPTASAKSEPTASEPTTESVASASDSVLEQNNLKKLYNLIMLQLHPDKSHIEPHKLYHDIQQLYHERGSYNMMLSYAIECNVDVSSILNEDIMDDIIGDIMIEIDKLKLTNLWNYGLASDKGQFAKAIYDINIILDKSLD
jgi:hypothetical protein